MSCCIESSKICNNTELSREIRLRVGEGAGEKMCNKGAQSAETCSVSALVFNTMALALLSRIVFPTLQWSYPAPPRIYCAAPVFAVTGEHLISKIVDSKVAIELLKRIIPVSCASEEFCFKKSRPLLCDWVGTADNNTAHSFRVVHTLTFIFARSCALDLISCAHTLKFR